MDALDLLLNRVSVPRLVAPGPDAGQRELLFRAALRAPDHAQLRPWRFLTVEGEALAQLGEQGWRGLDFGKFNHLRRGTNTPRRCTASRQGPLARGRLAHGCGGSHTSARAPDQAPPGGQSACGVSGSGLRGGLA